MARVWDRVEAVLQGERVRLEPVRVEHADELAPVLDDPLLHTFIGGEPVDQDQLRARYRRQVVGRSPDGSRRWFNWLVLRPAPTQAGTAPMWEDWSSGDPSGVLCRTRRFQIFPSTFMSRSLPS